MNGKRALLVLCLCSALVGAFFIPGLTAKAASISVTFDAGGDAYTVLYGTVSDIGGAHANVLTRPNISNARVRIDLPSNSTVTHAELQAYKNAAPPYSLGRGIWLYNASDTLLSYTFGSSATYNLSYENWSSHEWVTASWDGSVSGVSYIIALIASNGTWTDYLDNIAITYTSDSPTVTPSASPTPTATYAPVASWSKPLRSGEQKFDDVSYHPGLTYIDGFTGAYFLENTSGWGSGNYNLNVGFSNSSIVNVYAVHSGTVDSVVSVSYCTTLTIGAPAGLCSIFWNTTISTAYFVSIDNAYIVTELLDDGRYIRYLVLSPTVQTGEHLTAGCVIGTTLPLRGIGGGELGDGAILLQALEPDGATSFDVSQFLISEPSGIACAAQTPVGSCHLTANAIFNQEQGAWQASVGDSIHYALGAGLVFPSDVQQPLNLDYAAQYRITYIYQIEAGGSDQSFMIRLGSTNLPQTLTGAPGQNITVTLDAGYYTADRDDGLYTLRALAESGQADQTTLKFLCVEDAADNPIANAEGCILLDPTFGSAGNDSPWMDLFHSPLATIYPGLAELPDGAHIVSQPFLLNPADGGPQDYDLTVTYRRKGIAAAGESVSLDWNSDITNDGSFAAVFSQTWVEATDTITISSPTTEQLEITAVGSDGDQIAQISKVCITPHEGGTPPGYYPPAPFQGGCRYCVYTPTGDVATDISEFQQWLACQFFQLWECQAKILLRYIWTALVNILTLLGFFRLWLSATLIGLASWANGNLIVFAQWLYGQINNAAQEIVYAILSTSGGGGGGGTNLWDFLIALINGIFGLLSVFVTLVANIMQLIIAGVIGFLVNGIGLLLGLLQSVINGLNTAPAAIDTAWLPNCNDASSGLFVVCSAIYGVESGLAIGPFQYLVPLGVGLGALNLLWWGIAKIKGVFTE